MLFVILLCVMTVGASVSNYDQTELEKMRQEIHDNTDKITALQRQVDHIQSLLQQSTNVKLVPNSTKKESTTVPTEITKQAAVTTEQTTTLVETTENKQTTIELTTPSSSANASSVYDAIKGAFELNQLELKRRACNTSGGLAYLHMCIKLGYTRGYGGTLGEARGICENQGGKLAEMFSDQMVDATIKYVLSKWQGYKWFPRNWVSLWLGSTYQGTEDDGQWVVLSNGTKIRSDRWRVKGVIDLSTTSTILLLDVRTKGKRHGLWNAWPAWTGGVPLCSFDF